MSDTALRDQLARIPDASPRDDLDAAIADTVSYLGSDAALRSLATDVYWPKWHSPWWHMLLMFELGEARRIPARTVTAMVDGLNAMPLKIFPIWPDDAPGANLWRDCACHCALGCMHRVLSACDVDVDRALPWIKPWFSRYQMVDGGLNCDDAAYRVQGECPSSMVGTVAAFEAMTLGAWTTEQRAFLERGAAFLFERRLMLGSSTAHNAEEREAEARWLAPCFPRFYYYDVLRGLAALVAWGERSGRGIPRAAVVGAVDHLAAAFPDGVVTVQRQGFAICPTTWGEGEGGWSRQATSSFPLLEATSAVGRPSAALTRQWAATRRGLLALIDAGQIVD